MDSAAIQAVYDRVAQSYAAQMFRELDHKPFDCDQLDRLAERTAGRGCVVDLGCGPAQIARYLNDRGADAIGIDLSHQMLVEARRLSPSIPFQRHNLLRLGLRDGSLAGIAAFYAIVNCTLDDVALAAREIARVLAPDGLALVAFHIRFAGATTHERTHRIHEFLGHQVTATFSFFTADEVARCLTDAGMEIEQVLTRLPYPDVEAQTERAYVWVRKP